MSFRAFMDEIKKGLPSRNYVLSSSDPFLHAEAVAAIKSLVPPDELDFSFHVFDLLDLKDGSFTFDRIPDELNTVPFFSGRKYVIVNNSHKLLKKDMKKLDTYLAAPSDSSSLIMMHAGAVKKDMKDQLKGMKVIPVDISEREVPEWVRSKSAQMGLKMSGRAVDYLVGAIGPDLGLLSSEIEKCLLIGKDEIGEDDISEIIEGKRTYNAFALIDAIGQRNRDSAFRIYRVLEQTEEPYSLLGALNWQYSRSLAERTSPSDIRYYCEVFRELKRADKEIKSSGSPYPMELLLSRLMRISRRR